ncbi:MULTISPECIES: TusE/DsrC/DsvC family sulfur relay protein [unclassified Zymobacter]|uniref:TusE/DsrC/DsvC family sulfur relay protein n=1 Tax=unclassified Zymobacter TaxID=3048685 RepID=UPI0039C169A1
MTVDYAALSLDAEGYLEDLSIWTPEVAEALASHEGRVLTPAHWEIIDVVRSFYTRFEMVPAMRPLVKAVRTALGEGKGASLYLMALFPEDEQRPESPAKIVARLAGLPRPTNCH